MKRSYFFLIATLIMISCDNHSTNPLLTDCSVKVSDIVFSKSLNEGKDYTHVLDENRLVLSSKKSTDYFNAPDGKSSSSTAPLLLFEVNNSAPFTFTGKISPQFTESYDAGALYIYVNNNLWQKLAFEMDERSITRIVSVRTIDTSDDNNHEIISQAGVYMKISSDTKQIGFYYSLDKENWNLLRIYKNDYPPLIYLGVSSQSPVGNGNQTLFEDLSFTKNPLSDFRLGI